MEPYIGKNMQKAKTLTEAHFAHRGVKIIASIPCHNTEGTIKRIVLETKTFVNKVFVVDDGSTDLTAKEAIAGGATVMSHFRNRGYGEAIKTCFSAARDDHGDILVIIDGDGQHNPSDIPSLLAPILNQDADVVIGSRLLDFEGNIPKYRKLGIDVITGLWNFCSQVKVSDAQSGFRAYNLNAIKDLNISENGMSASIEILEKIRQNKCRIKEVSISCSYKDNNSSLSLKAIRHGASVAISVVKIRLKKDVVKNTPNKM